MSKRNSKIVADYRGDPEHERELLSYIVAGPKPVDSNPWWLKSDFWAPIWYGSFGEGLRIEINWQIMLSNGATLLERNKASHALRALISAQSHHSTLRGMLEAPRSAYAKIGEAIRLVDLFLLHYPHDELLEYGFSALSEGDVISILSRLANGADTEETIYEWTNSLANFLRNYVESSVTERDIDYFRDKYPLIGLVNTSVEDRLLPCFDDEQIILARIALLKQGLYRPPKYRFEESSLEPDNTAICRILYRNTLNGISHKTTIPELCWGEDDSYVREFSGVFVRQGEHNERLSKRALLSYARRLAVLPHLSSLGLAPSQTAIDALKKENVYIALRLAPPGRFRSVPTEHMLFAIRNAITLFLTHGDHIFDSYVRVASALDLSGLTPGRFDKKHNVSKICLPETMDLGVKTLTLSRLLEKRNDDDVYKRPLERQERYRLIRNNRGLFELLRTLYGAIALTVGALSARRRGELLDLPAEGCLDETQTNLIFEARKTGIAGHRQVLIRPIPPIVVRMINRIRNFQYDLVRHNLLTETGALFATPNIRATRLSAPRKIDVCMDCFFDYIEMPLSRDLRRYYIRFHQTRRFFPQVFMDSGIDANIDVIEYFLGHTNREEVWTYILETCSGDAINQSAAQSATAQLRAGNLAFEELANLLYEVYGVRDFWAVSEEELNGYILSLEELGDIRPEIEYFSTPDGQRHRMLMKVIRKNL